jgi:two-component system sensor histidine kinase TctE
MPKPRQSSLRRQLLMHLAGPLLAVLALGAAGGMIIARHVGYVVHDQWLLDSAMTLEAQIKGSDGHVALSLPPAAIQMFEWDRIDRIYWQASSGRQGGLLSNAEIPPPPEVLLLNKPQYYDANVGGQPVRVVALEKPAPAGVDDTVRILVAETMHKRELVAGKIFNQWAPLQLAVLMLAGTFIWLAVTRNLSKVNKIAARLGTYETDSLSPVANTEQMPAEISPLISAINRLIRKLREEQDSQKRFISNAAHQLRTPLATLQVQTQRVRREHDPVRHDQALDDVHRAVTRLHHVTHQLLTLMRSEQQTEKHLKLAPVDLADLARQEVERWADSALSKGIDLGYDGPDQGVMITGDHHLLRELMGNLIDNAIRYNQAGGTVTLNLSGHPVCVTVEDNGPGIPEHERGLVLERFYRGSHSEAAGGCGLGLPIAYEIAARHGAQLSLHPGPGAQGTSVQISFPY